ncbi:hypothetical protein [Candidatus Phytoplasma pini]|uniref:Uncharacterized protein n=1 Tax=Candidatus Phytoplasma pini TaxID=267362 RepID=A0A559KJB1_9MOLU|nr:hypothetical protein [Candidatus Phytoplasma pini]TVY12221.1 hypothetical protein MDPP_00289 [Candidatus Phytoplasma pini]
MIYKDNKIQKNNLKKPKLVKSFFSDFNSVGKVYFLFILFITFLTFIFNIIVKMKTISFSFAVILEILFFYFTDQTILSVFLILLTFFFRIRNYKKFYYFLIFSVVVNVLLTFLVYNMVLFPFWKKQNIFNIYLIEENQEISFIINFSQHFLIPLLFFLFFLFFIPLDLNLKKIIFTFLHPIIYLMCWCIKLYNESGCCSFEKCKIPYRKILCPQKGDFLVENFWIFKGKEMVLFRILILFCIFSIFFYFVFRFKNFYNNENCLSKK